MAYQNLNSLIAVKNVTNSHYEILNRLFVLRFTKQKKFLIYTFQIKPNLIEKRVAS